MTSEASIDRPIPADDGNSSVADLIGEVADDLTRLVQQQIQLAKAELKQEATKAGKATGMVAGAAVSGFLSAIVISFAIVYGLAAVMPAGWAALIVAIMWALIAATLYRRGRRRMREVSAVPRQTVATLKEDMQWLRNPTR